MGSVILLTRGKRETMKFNLSRVGSGRTRSIFSHEQEKEGRMTPTLLTFVQRTLQHAPTFSRMLCGPSVNPKKRIRSRRVKFTPSYNPSFCVSQIPIRATARIARNTTHSHRSTEGQNCPQRKQPRAALTVCDQSKPWLSNGRISSK